MSKHVSIVYFVVLLALPGFAMANSSQTLGPEISRQTKLVKNAPVIVVSDIETGQLQGGLKYMEPLQSDLKYSQHFPSPINLAADRGR